MVNILATVFIGIQFIFLIYTIFNRNATDVHFFTYDNLGLLFFTVLSILAASTLYYSIAYLDEETLSQYRIYFISFIILCAAITGAYFSNNATLSWILIEATTLAAAMLIYHRRTPRALEAAWKYVLICSIGIALAYLGILFLSIMLKGQHEMNLSYESLRMAAQTANPLHLKIAFLLIFIGYSAKMEVFPLYSIGIDANHAALAPMSGFFSTALVNLGFISIFRIYNVILVSEIAEWSQNVLLIGGFISILVAAVYLLQVKHYKRLLSYSTVENMGIVLVSMSFGKIGCFFAIFHTLMHSFVKSSSFYSISRIGKLYDGYKMDSIGGYWKINPIGAVALLLCLVGLIAVPPSPLFISELTVFQLMLLHDRWFIFIIITLLLCFVLYALLSKLLYICYSTPSGNNIFNKIDDAERRKVYAQFILLGIFFFFGIFQPEWFVNLITDAIPSF
ncbi:MAG: hydrogenase 4 subunit F [Prevotellaceae bacterium]|jgi:hydrogenase-4 component F|nr:hydrogenase 4 subunit F [Prevotellaceae bacterium]